MANEAAIRVRIDNPLPFTVADGTGIEKGAVLELSGDKTAILSSGAEDKIAGILAREKVASDGRTEMGVFRRGWFDMVCSGAVLLGEAVSSMGHDNYIHKAPVTASGACILGHALETGSDAERILIDVNVGAGGNQVT